VYCDLVEPNPSRFRRGAPEGERRAGGCVSLLVVVGLDDLQVEIRESAGGAGHEVEEQGHAGREVRGDELWCFRRMILQAVDEIGPQTRGTHDEADASKGRKGVKQRFGGAEIDGDIHSFPRCFVNGVEHHATPHPRCQQTGIVSEPTAASNLQRGDQFEVRGLLDAMYDLSPHPPRCTDHSDPDRHFKPSFSRIEPQEGPR
jgi:hypothetical protein